MKLLIVFVAVALTCVLCAKDPTTVCLPDVFQTDLYSVTEEDFGYLAIDFNRELLGIHYVRAGYRAVFNLTDFSGHFINYTDVTCTQISAGESINNVVTRCLPASAILLTNGSRIGVPPNSVDVEGWEIDVGSGVTRVALTATNPAVPVLREYTSGSTVDVVFIATPRLPSHTLKYSLSHLTANLVLLLVKCNLDVVMRLTTIIFITLYVIHVLSPRIFLRYVFLPLHSMLTSYVDLLSEISLPINAM